MKDNNLVGTEVYAVSRPGDGPNKDHATRVGEVVEYKEGVNWVEWENGHREPVWNIENADEFNGLGVYK